MNVALLCHSLVSDWNHGNAHFLRGVVRELQRRGHRVRVLEPADGWSRRNLIAERGPDALLDFYAAFPGLRPIVYDAERLDLDALVGDADLVLVHEWTEPHVVAALGRRRASGGRFRLLFHDTHHRAVSDATAIGGLDLDAYDGVLAFGAVLSELYARRGWTGRVWTWHEAADTVLFHPHPADPRADLVWIGNWGDDERSAELHEFLIEPVAALGLSADVHGVRYPDAARAALRARGLRYRGWLANHRVPETFARHRVTVHIPRRPYVTALPGIPTIRIFEALACAIPLVSAPWNDVEALFAPGDFLVARDGAEMCRHLRAVLADPDLAADLAARGLRTIAERHTCAHRVDELSAVCATLGVRDTTPTQPLPAAS